MSRAAKIGLGAALVAAGFLCAHDLWWFQHPAPCRPLQTSCASEFTSDATSRAMTLGLSVALGAIAGLAAWRIFAISRLQLRAFALGLSLLLIALIADNVDFAGGRDAYRFALFVAIPCWLGAAVSLGSLAREGGIGWRITAGILFLPTIFLFAGFARRVPYVFGPISESSAPFQ